ncbi:MAG: helix-turn-helix transcriptional regulator [Clostridia bacterium]|nr:helix-turn-helix transcriptional regulator [Clostridia bacterium]
MTRYVGPGHRDDREPRKTLVRGPVCPGIYVEDPQITLARNVTRLIKKWQKNGITQKKFSELSGVNPATLVRIRKGLTWPEPGTLQKLASTFGVPLEVLFRR